MKASLSGVSGNTDVVQFVKAQNGINAEPMMLARRQSRFNAIAEDIEDRRSFP
jgi:hypothetical protein